MLGNDTSGPRRLTAIAALLFAAGAIAAFIIVSSWPSSPQTTTPAAAEALIDRFEKVAFRDDLTPEMNPALFRTRLVRWEHPLRIGYHNIDDGVRAHVQGFLEELQGLIGRRVWVPDEDAVTAANIKIQLLKDEDYEILFDRLKLALDLQMKIEDIVCFVDLSQIRHPYHPSISIHFSPIHSRRDFRTCVLEEIVQGLGLFGDTLGEFDSLFVQYGQPRLDFPLNDKILLRTLYDPRLRDGMPREQAMVRVRQIIPELLAAYEAEGVEGLYQPLRDPSW